MVYSKLQCSNVFNPAFGFIINWIHSGYLKTCGFIKKNKCDILSKKKVWYSRNRTPSIPLKIVWN
jgi:hypothetical protein